MNESIVMWACPVCDGFMTSNRAGLNPPGGPAVCEHPSSGYLTEYATRDPDDVADAMRQLAMRVQSAASTKGEGERP